MCIVQLLKIHIDWNRLTSQLFIRSSKQFSVWIPSYNTIWNVCAGNIQDACVHEKMCRILYFLHFSHDFVNGNVCVFFCTSLSSSIWCVAVFFRKTSEYFVFMALFFPLYHSFVSFSSLSAWNMHSFRIVLGWSEPTNERTSAWTKERERESQRRSAVRI